MSNVILKSIFPVSKTVRTRTGAANTVIGLQGATGATGAAGAAGPNTVTTSTTTNLTGVLLADGKNISASATVPSANLPIASSDNLGAIRVGSNLKIEGSGILDVNNLFSLQNGSATLAMIPNEVRLTTGSDAGVISSNGSLFLQGGDFPITVASPLLYTSANVYPLTTTLTNYDLEVKTYHYLRDDLVASGVTFTFRGLSGAGFDNSPFWFINPSTSTFVLKHQDSANTAEGRFLCSTEADIELRPNEIVEIIYDQSQQRYRVFPPARPTAIGGTVTGATVGRVLYVGAGPVLADSSGLQYIDHATTPSFRLANSNGARGLNLTFDINGNNIEFKTFGSGVKLIFPSSETVEVYSTFLSTNFSLIEGLQVYQFGQSLRIRSRIDQSVANISNPFVVMSEITSDRNDYALTQTARSYRISSNSNINITGLAPVSTVDGKELLLINVGSNVITFKHQDAGSSAANRIICTTGADIALSANEAVEAIYDSTTSRWRMWKL